MLHRLGVPVSQAGGLDEAGRLAQPDVVLDGVLGYSLSGTPRGPAAALIRWANAAQAPVVSLDTPSGLDVDTGRPHDPTAVAAATVTLALPKPGLLAPAAARHVGALYLADIGVPAEVFAAVGVVVGPLFATSDLLRLPAGA